jgi:hypothetical protein
VVATTLLSCHSERGEEPAFVSQSTLFVAAIKSRSFASLRMTTLIGSHGKET